MADDNLKGILPAEKVWKFGDREFTQTPLAMDRTGQLLGLIGGALFDGMMSAAGAANINEQVIAIGLLNALRKEPGTLTNLLCILLNAQAEGDFAYIGANIKFSETLAIVREFLKQNDVMALKKDFLTFWSELEMSLGNDKPSKKTS